MNCGHCHTCGTRLRKVLDGEEWCDHCQAYRRYTSHGWGSHEDNSRCITTCTYCHLPESAHGFFSVPLCDKHIELSVYIGRLEKRGIEPTAENIRRLMAYKFQPVDISPDEVQELLDQYNRHREPSHA